MFVENFPHLPPDLAIFGPSNPRSKYNEAQFQNLKSWNFTAKQKNFFAGQCINQISEGDPNIRLGDSGRQLKARYNLAHSTVNRWITNLRSSSKINHGGYAGRPLSIDQQGLMECHAEIQFPHHQGDNAYNISVNVPSVLFPMNLRGGPRYRSLRRHIFTPIEKKWVCAHLVQFCEDFDNDLEVISNIRIFGNRYDVSGKIVAQWIEIYANGGDFY
jgi:hypothetical protein